MIEVDTPKRAKNVIYTDKLERIHEILERRFCPHRITLEGGQRNIVAEYGHATFANSRINHLKYGARVKIEPKPFEHFYMIHIPLAGSAMISADGHETVAHPGTAVVISPSSNIHTRWSEDCRQILVQLDRAQIEKLLSELVGKTMGPSLSFRAPVDLERGLGSAFWGLLQYLSQALGSCDAMGRAWQIPEQFERTLACMLLSSGRHNYSAALEAEAGLPSPRHVARAYEYIEAMAHDQVTMEDLVRVAGVSARSLQEGFKRFKGASPMACLRSVRLRRARRDLLALESSGDIAQIARRCGFTHLGRFANYYKAAFGELPKDTLKR
jgi:AraC-like DNA-binding protein